MPPHITWPLLCALLLATACGGGDPETGTSAGGDAEPGQPVYGGELVYGLEAESSGGWCLPESTAWAVTPGRKLLPAKTRAFIEMLQQVLRCAAADG